MSSSLGTPNGRPIREEIIELAAALADSQARLQSLATRLENGEEDQWRKRYENLEILHQEAVNAAKWLRVQNAELESRVQNFKPEINNALAAREDAFNKLKHARKVIRDLLTERGDMSSPRSSGSQTLTREEIEEALGDTASHSSSSSSGSTQSDRTVRVHTVNSPSQTEGRDFGSPMTLAAFPVAESALMSPTSKSVTRQPELSSPQHWRKSSHSSPRTGSSRRGESLLEVISRTQSPSGSRASISPELWHLHFKNPPGVSPFQEGPIGPIEWDRLGPSLKLDEDTVKSLYSLKTCADIGMRLTLTHYEHKATVACVYDPIIIENPKRSYLLEWGRARANQNLGRYISSHKTRADQAFHTFLFPPTEGNWYYIGALEWTPAQGEVADFWPTLDDDSKKRVLRKLVKRTRGEVNEAEMTNLLDSGELQQFCVELTLVGDGHMSYEFATEVLGRQGSPYSPSRHERRAAGVKE